ncbi:hypothetical protein [Paenibacillus gallinarum]|uniref:Uncharacterized protein n=1 Tax=Paenibacillus gallinarum TaxID=2762232 RepID=A0ABR8T0F5_9BACL|nr:hypothetical protein [Paenibacillus gallinarum]MBD7969233.1 hypothetical protein [Paenibacillus gallinarum]
MYRKIIRRSILLIVLLLLINYLFNNSGFYITESKAIRDSYPYKNGDVIYEKEYENKKIIILKTSDVNYVKLIGFKLGMFYHVSNIAELYFMTPLIGKEGDIKRTWSASLNSNELYETMIAVESENPEIKRVIVSNDNIDNVILDDLEEIKENSTVFLELKLEDGFATSYLELYSKDVGGFIFRGVNEKGEIITLGR